MGPGPVGMPGHFPLRNFRGKGWPSFPVNREKRPEAVLGEVKKRPRPDQALGPTTRARPPKVESIAFRQRGVIVGKWIRHCRFIPVGPIFFSFSRCQVWGGLANVGGLLLSSSRSFFATGFAAESCSFVIGRFFLHKPKDGFKAFFFFLTLAIENAWWE